MKNGGNFLQLEYIFKNTKGSFVLIELNQGIFCNGKIERIDEFLNICISDAILTSKSGFFFKKVERFYVRGKNIKIARIT
jgi:small nuclear ribonucleoprotein (snRNP)-like protein